jgi:mono/diheme cytochrome c family protein
MRQVRNVILGALVCFAITACGGNATTTSTDSADLVAGDARNGADVYMGYCSACHGGEAAGIEGLGKPLVNSAFVADKSEDQLAAFIKEGRSADDPDNMTGIAMPPSGGNQRLTDQDLLDVSAYLLSLNP